MNGETVLRVMNDQIIMLCTKVSLLLLSIDNKKLFRSKTSVYMYLHEFILQQFLLQLLYVSILEHQTHRELYRRALIQNKSKLRYL